MGAMAGAGEVSATRGIHAKNKTNSVNQDQRLCVSFKFVSAVQLPYLLMEISDDYQNCMVGYPSRAYLWIMSKNVNMNPEIYNKYVKIAEDQKYDVSKIIKPQHSGQQKENEEKADEVKRDETK